jgi:sulfoxide reductase catalytic subunit YedY
MLIKKPADIKSSEITPEQVYLDRRRLLKSAGFLGAGALLAGQSRAEDIPAEYQRLENIKKNPLSTDETPNSFSDIASYNNFYEFGTDKADPAANSGNFQPKPWSVMIEGEAEVTGEFTLEDILKPHALEERIYRLRCVEAWSMVVPWVGIPLGDLLKRFKPTSRAKYVYGVELPNQNGAPLRLVVPWKYGFKSIKSIVRISFTEDEPYTTWNASAPFEYGFYANVNPEVDHPRWSQARERVIGGGFFDPKIPTRMFNGYAEQVASLYTGMDLTRFY